MENILKNNAEHLSADKSMNMYFIRTIRAIFDSKFNEMVLTTDTR